MCASRLVSFEWFSRNGIQWIKQGTTVLNYPILGPSLVLTESTMHNVENVCVG